MHIGKELEAHQGEKGCLSCDSDAPHVGSARSDLTRVMVVKVNHCKTNRCKMRPYCVYISHVFYSIENNKYVYVFTVISITKEH